MPIHKANFVITITFCILVTFCIPQRALACSCAQEQELFSIYEDASIVFIGRVVDLSTNPLRKEQVEVKFDIATHFKGLLPHQHSHSLLVYTPSEKSLCGSHFSVGMDYLIFANGSPAYYKTNICMRNKQLEIAQEDIKVVKELSEKHTPKKTETESISK